MAIVQVSRITHRKGLSENLPQLAGAELGWVINDRKLYIGNGTLEEGAPAIGNTEILTEYSDILNLAASYTYKGEAGGYTVQTGPTTSSPTTRSLQRKIDDFASVKDFGAVGDGTTDDTAAINRAFYQLFCREDTTESRRSLFFPAGNYLVTDTIKIPTYAKVYGEGSDSTIISLDISSSADYVARTADSLQQTGGSIGTNNALTPRNIEVSDLTFRNETTGDVFFLEDARECYFQNVIFRGPLLIDDLTVPGGSNVAVAVDSSAAAITSRCVFDSCKFRGTPYAFDVNAQTNGISVVNSTFTLLYRGVRLGNVPVDGGPKGFKVTQCLFDLVAREGVLFYNELNVSGYNTFLDVGTNFQGGDQTPVSHIIVFEADNNVSIGDMFERGETQNLALSRIDTNNNKVFALDNAERYKFGTYIRKVGETSSISVTGSPTTITTLDINQLEAFNMKYTFKDSSNAIVRHGTFNCVAAEDPGDSTGSLTYDEEYRENNTSGLVLSASQSGNTISVQYTATVAGTFNFSINQLG